MMRIGMLDRATPCIVHACTIQNKSNGTVYVRILYEPVRLQEEDTHERRVEFYLVQGGETHIDQEEFDMGSFQRREAIRTVEVTRINGQIQEINAPFENVNGIELDWLFIIEDRNIRSLEHNSQ